mmetsp:Transcript_2812/g.6741  ORF Transcript_2812/g.6741 Transcript_2812/m.6741 type:complete len:80 (-) Transcript_2812:2982-3221(-)
MLLRTEIGESLTYETYCHARRPSHLTVKVATSSTELNPAGSVKTSITGSWDIPPSIWRMITVPLDAPIAPLLKYFTPTL